MTLYLMDTNAFNNICDAEDVDVATIARQAQGRVYVTHIQQDEVNNTRDVARRDVLRGCLQTINAEPWPTETFMIGKSRLGMARLSDGRRYHAILDELNNRKKKRSNEADALIGETAEARECVLVSDDQDLSEVMREVGVQVIGWRQFVKELSDPSPATSAGLVGP